MGDESVLERPHRVLLSYNHASVLYLGIRHKLFFFFWFWLWDLSSPTRYRTRIPYIGRLEFSPLDHQGNPQSVITIFPIFFTFFPPHKACPWVIMKLVPSLFSFRAMCPLGFTSPRFFRVLIVMEENRWLLFFKDISPVQNEPCKRKEMYNTRCWIINDDISGTSEREIGVSVNFAHIPPNNVMLVRSIMTIQSGQSAINFRKPASGSP